MNGSHYLNPTFTSHEDDNQTREFINSLYSKDDYGASSTPEHHLYHTVTLKSSTTTNPTKAFDNQACTTEKAEPNLAPVYQTVTPRSSSVNGQAAKSPEYNTLQHRMNSKVNMEDSESNQPPVYQTVTPKGSLSSRITSGQQIENSQEYHHRISSKVDIGKGAEYQVPDHSSKSSVTLPTVHFYDDLTPPSSAKEQVDDKVVYNSLLHGVSSTASVASQPAEYLVPQRSQKATTKVGIEEPSIAEHIALEQSGNIVDEVAEYLVPQPSQKDIRNEDKLEPSIAEHTTLEQSGTVVDEVTEYLVPQTSAASTAKDGSEGLQEQCGGGGATTGGGGAETEMLEQTV